MPAPTSQARSLQVRPSNGLVPGRLTAEAQSSERLPRRASAPLCARRKPRVQADLGNKGDGQTVLREVKSIVHSHAFADVGPVSPCFARRRFGDVRCYAHASQRSPVDFRTAVCKSFRERDVSATRQPPGILFTELGLALRVEASLNVASGNNYRRSGVGIDKAGQ